MRMFAFGRSGKHAQPICGRIWLTIPLAGPGVLSAALLLAACERSPEAVAERPVAASAVSELASRPEPAATSQAASSLAAKAAAEPVRLTPSAIARLFERLKDPDPSRCEEDRAVLSSVSLADPNWTVAAFLTGELCLGAGRDEAARQSFKELVAHSGATQSSALAAVGLWRWLQLFEASKAAPGEVDALLAQAARLQATPQFEGMVRSGLLQALPLMEEDIARRLAAVARNANRPEANDLLLAFISIDSTGELNAAEQLQVLKLIEDGIFSRPRLDLFRYRRQLSMVQTEARKAEAVQKLHSMWLDASAPAPVRAEAAFEWGNYQRLKNRRAAIEALSAAFELSGETGPVAERALYGRAMLYGSGEHFEADLTRFIAAFPRSRLIDDALYQLGSEQIFGNKLKDGLSTFAELRRITSSNDWADSAYFVPAIGLLTRGSPDEENLAAADALLEDYATNFPQGVFRFRGLFWRGRIAEWRQPDGDAARKLFQQVVAEVPFDYYGLRARMHLRAPGQAAASHALPDSSSEVLADLRAAFAASRRPDGTLVGDIPAIQRLRSAHDSGLYALAGAKVDDLGRRYWSRMDAVPLEQLSRDRALPAVALLLAWRQDALGTRQKLTEAGPLLSLSAFMGYTMNDWPLAMVLLAVPESDPRSRLSALQTNEHYLATAYPGPADVSVLRHMPDDPPLKVQGSRPLGQSLMYGVMRRESAFYPGAISAAGALGLFQILPKTFAATKAACRRGADPSRPQAFLFNAGNSIKFWACFAQVDMRPKDRDDLAMMLVRQNAGSGNLSKWAATWNARTKADLELQVESLRFPATQVFVRQVLVDVAIAEAAGLFGDIPDPEGGRR